MADLLPIPLRRYLDRQRDTNQRLLDNNIKDRQNNVGMLESAALTAVDGITWAGDTAFNAGLGLLDTVTPEVIDEGVGLLASTAVDAVVNSGPGKATKEWFDGLSPQDQRRVQAGIDIAGLTAGGKIVQKGTNAAARNASTFVRDFYSGDPIKAIKGTMEAFGLKGVRGAVREAFTPEGIARMRTTGVPQGVYDELKSFKELYQKLDNKDFVNMTGNDVTNLEAMRYQSGMRKYIAGELAMKYQILKQQGIPSPELKKLVEDVQVVHTNTMDNMGQVGEVMFDSGRLGAETPSVIRDHATKQLTAQYVRGGRRRGLKAMAKPDDLQPASRTQIIVRANDAGANIRQEAFMKGPGGAIFGKGKQFKGMTREQVVKKLGDPNHAMLDDGWMVVRDSYSSSAKELGGVGRRTYFHPESGEAYSFIDDYSDIFGMNPLGGQGLLVVSAPIRRNVYSGDKKVYGNVDRNKDAIPEVPMRPSKTNPNKMVPSERKGFNTTQEGRLANSIIDADIQPTLRDKAQVGVNVAKPALGAGLFATDLDAERRQ